MLLRGLIVALGLGFMAMGSVECKELHDLLTDEEFYSVFRTTRDNATPYIHENMRGNTLDVQAAHTDQTSYWGHLSYSNPDFDYRGYHIIMTLTDANLYDYRRRQSLIGLAALSSLCHPVYRGNFPTVAITHDTGKCRGIVTATHELGHVFDADHDESPDGDCAKKLGYLMTPSLKTSPLMNKWSPCSLRMIERVLGENFLYIEGRHCADKQAGNAGNPIDRIAPGDMMSAQLQCKALDYSYACDPKPQMCKRLQCYWAWFTSKGFFGTNQCQDAIDGALDGTPCSQDHPAAICVSGECRNGIEVLE